MCHTVGFLGPQIIASFIATPVSLHTPIQFKTKPNQTRQMPPRQQDGGIPCSTNFAVCSRNISSTLNHRQTLGPIYLFIPYSDFSLEKLALSTPVSTSPTTSLLQICLHTFGPHGRYHSDSHSPPSSHHVISIATDRLGGRRGGMWTKKCKVVSSPSHNQIYI